MVCVCDFVCVQCVFGWGGVEGGLSVIQYGGGAFFFFKTFVLFWEHTSGCVCCSVYYGNCLFQVISDVLKFIFENGGGGGGPSRPTRLTWRL